MSLQSLVVYVCIVQTEQRIGHDSKPERRVIRNGGKVFPESEDHWFGELSLARMLRCRMRCFADGVVIGSRAFVNETSVSACECFGPNRKAGARRLRGSSLAAAVREFQEYSSLTS